MTSINILAIGHFGLEFHTLDAYIRNDVLVVPMGILDFNNKKISTVILNVKVFENITDCSFYIERDTEQRVRNFVQKLTEESCIIFILKAIYKAYGEEYCGDVVDLLRELLYG